ncbi:hypothetical protein ILYODFUR_037089, partial [Ilyodon furcidens]
VSTGMPAKPAAFTFVPVLHKLPIKSILVKNERSATPKGKSDKVQQQHQQQQRPKSDKVIICATGLRTCDVTVQVIKTDSTKWNKVVIFLSFSLLKHFSAISNRRSAILD